MWWRVVVVVAVGVLVVVVVVVVLGVLVVVVVVVVVGVLVVVDVVAARWLTDGRGRTTWTTHRSSAVGPVQHQRRRWWAVSQIAADTAAAVTGDDRDDVSGGW